MQIHSSNAVIVRFITTVFTTEKMYLLVTVSLFCMTAFGTSLACISRINLFYKLMML